MWFKPSKNLAKETTWKAKTLAESMIIYTIKSVQEVASTLMNDVKRTGDALMHKRTSENQKPAFGGIIAMQNYEGNVIEPEYCYREKDEKTIFSIFRNTVKRDRDSNM